MSSHSLLSITKIYALVIFFFLKTFQTTESCVLCPSRLPSKPKPLDQFRLPSIPKIMETSDSITQLCYNNSRLNTFRDSCRTDVSHLFCSLTRLVEYLNSECPSGSENIDDCSKCQRNNAEIYEKNSWIVTWIDSIGKMPSGISDGNYHWLGDYEQCQKLKENELFNGRYCMLEFQVPDAVLRNVQCENYDPLEVNLGICLPAGCSASETKELVEYVSNHDIKVHCQPPHQWPILAKLFLALLLLWVFIIFAASLMHFFCVNPNYSLTTDDSIQLHERSETNESLRQSKINLYLTKFIFAISLQENMRTSLRTTRKYSREFHSVQGLQVLSVCLVTFGNVIFLIMPYLENVGYFYYLIDLWFVQPLVNSSFYVDGLLALGALRLTLKPRESFKTFSDLLNALKKRFLRIWPTYVIITLFITILYVRLGEGPMWSHNDVAQRCSSTWYSNILLINNLIGYSATCLDGGFLIALEVQFYIIGFTLIYLVASKRLNEFTLKCVAYSIIFASVVYTFAVSFRYETIETLSSTISVPFSQRSKMYVNFINKIYLNPLARIAPFMLGLVLPTQLRQTRFFNMPIFTPLISLFCLAFSIYVIWTPYVLAFDLHLFSSVNLTRLTTAFYCATHRLAWAFVVIYLAHFLNNSSPRSSLNAIFGWRILHPLSKLVYVVFLISEPVGLSLFASLHRPINATPFSTLLTSLGMIVCSYIIAFLIDIFYSRPIANVIALFMANKK